MHFAQLMAVDPNLNAFDNEKRRFSTNDMKF